MDFEKYKKYLQNNWLPEYRDIYTTRDLSAEGWTMLMEEVFSPLIEKELGMKYMGNRVWADDYCCHRRRVLSLFLQTVSSGSIKWGWNFDFVPKLSAGKAVYARTDKSIFTHIFENCHYNHDDSVVFKSEMIFDRFTIDTADYEKSMQKKIDQHINAFYLTLPLIKTFYTETKTYEQTIEMIDSLLNHLYYRLIEGNQLYLAYLFLQQYVGMGEDNEKNICKLFDNESTRESFIKKFSKIPSDYNI
ncbi:hypothetical protein [Huintestinicola sp.]